MAYLCFYTTRYYELYTCDQATCFWSKYSSRKGAHIGLLVPQPFHTKTDLFRATINYDSLIINSVLKNLCDGELVMTMPSHVTSADRSKSGHAKV